jgi:hypothetical protein
MRRKYEKAANTNFGIWVNLYRLGNTLMPDIGSTSNIRRALDLTWRGIEFGESPEDAMVREVKEETGLRVNAQGIAFIDSIVIPKADEDFHGIGIVYEARSCGAETIISEDGGTTDLAQWHAWESLAHLPLVDLAEHGVRFARDHVF